MPRTNFWPRLGSGMNKPLLLLRIGLVAGTLDIGEDLIFNAFHHVTPAMVFRFIAAGATGVRAALAWGWAAVALGVVAHYFIAMVWTIVFYAASRRLRFLLRRPVAWGLVYGAIVYGFMNAVVLPLSRVPRLPATKAGLVNGVLAVLFCIGVAIAVQLSRAESAAGGAADVERHACLNR